MIYLIIFFLFIKMPILPSVVLLELNTITFSLDTISKEEIEERINILSKLGGYFSPDNRWFYSYRFESDSGSGRYGFNYSATFWTIFSVYRKEKYEQGIATITSACGTYYSPYDGNFGIRVCGWKEESGAVLELQDSIELNLNSLSEEEIKDVVSCYNNKMF